MNMYVPLCLLSIICGIANAGSLPSFIAPCSASDPQFSKCAEKAIQSAIGPFAKGIPELGVASLDPAHLGTINVDNPALKLIFTDTILSGLGGAVLNSYKISLEKGKALLDFTANVTMKAHYEMDGRVLILPIKGNGDAKIKITNLNIVVQYDFVTENGHWVVPKYNENYKMDRAQFKFTNLFNGKNKELAQTTGKFVNENWSLVITEIAPPALKQIIKQCIEEVTKFFAAVPVSMLVAP